MLRDTWLVFQRGLRLQLREPVWVIIGIVQPVLYLVLFGPLLEQIAAAPGFVEGDAWLTFTPAMVVLLTMFGAGFAGFATLAEKREGVIESMRVTPASRAALLFGRVLNNVVALMVQAAILVVLAVVAFGMRPSWAGVLLTFLLVALLGTVLSALSHALALVAPGEDTLASVLNGVSLPLLLLSGALLPMALAPVWLRTLSRLNPFAYVVDAARDLFAGNLASGDVAVGFAITVVLAVIATVIGTRTFQRVAA